MSRPGSRTLRNGKWRRRRPDRGLSLFELVIAMALFALLATLGLQALSGSVQLSGRLTARAADSGAESRATTLLRQDLARAVGLRFHPPEGPMQGALQLSADGLSFAFSIAGQQRLAAPAGAGLHRVVWRVDPAKQSLTRRIWPVLAPARATQQSPEVVQLTGVTGLRLRSYNGQTGWRAGLQPTGFEPDPGALDGDAMLLPDFNSDRLPLALELVLLRSDGTQLRFLEVLR